MLNIENLVFGYLNQEPVINRLTFHSPDGKITSLIGNSGSGKTTLLKLLIGILKPREGMAQVSGNYSYLSQTPTLLEYRNALENALLGCELREQFTPLKLQEAIRLFGDFKLSTATGKKFLSDLSGGMKQRIGIIQALLIEADCYILDEPFNSIDRNTNLVIQHYLWERSRQMNTSLLFVTHDLEHALRISDEVLLLVSPDVFVKLEFSSLFVGLPPAMRVQSPQYGEYLIQIVNALNQI